VRSVHPLEQPQAPVEAQIVEGPGRDEEQHREPPHELEGEEEEGALDGADGNEVALEAVDERVELLGAGAVGVGKEGRAEGSNDGTLPGSELKGHGVGREG